MKLTGGHWLLTLKALNNYKDFFNKGVLKRAPFFCCILNKPLKEIDNGVVMLVIKTFYK